MGGPDLFSIGDGGTGLTLVAGLGTVFTALIAIASTRVARKEAEKAHRMSRPEVSLEERLQSALQMIALAQVEIEARAKRAKDLQEQADQAKAAARLNETERGAIASLVQAQIASEGRRALWWTFGQGAIWFALGAISTFFVTRLVT